MQRCKHIRTYLSGRGPKQDVGLLLLGDGPIGCTFLGVCCRQDLQGRAQELLISEAFTVRKTEELLISEVYKRPPHRPQDRRAVDIRGLHLEGRAGVRRVDDRSVGLHGGAQGILGQYI